MTMSDTIAGIYKALGRSPGAPPCNPDMRTLRAIVAWLDQAAELIDDALINLERIEELPGNDMPKREIDEDLGAVENIVTSVADILWALRLETGLE